MTDLLEIIKNVVRRVARLIGLDVRRYDPLAFEHGRLALLLTENGVDLVLDIGANTGQWAKAVRRAGYDGDIISFEPLAAAHRELTRSASRDPRWKVAPRLALGERDSEVEINVAGNSVSSSLLQMLPMHVAGAPEAAYVGVETAPMKTLDSLIGSVIPTACRRVFCKLDVQGYETQVLAGAEVLMTRTVGLQMEMSLASLYQGQPLFAEVLDSMVRSGFEVYGFSPAFIDPKSGRMLQVDGVFFRSAAAEGKTR